MYPLAMADLMVSSLTGLPQDNLPESDRRILHVAFLRLGEYSLIPKIADIPKKTHQFWGRFAVMPLYMSNSQISA